MNGIAEMAARGQQAAGGALDPDQPIQLLGTPEQIASMWGALALAQGALPEIPKPKHVRIQMKSGGIYEYDYCPLAIMVKLCKPHLSANGLAVAQPMTLGNGGCVWTILAHAGGASLITQTRFTPEGDIKQLGGQTTYLARYAYQRLLGIDGDADADAVPGEGDKAAKVSDRRPPSSPPPGVQPADKALAFKCTQGTWDALQAARKELGLKGPVFNKLCKDVAGDPARQMSEEGALKVHEKLLGDIVAAEADGEGASE